MASGGCIVELVVGLVVGEVLGDHCTRLVPGLLRGARKHQHGGRGLHVVGARWSRWELAWVGGDLPVPF